MSKSEKQVRSEAEQCINDVGEAISSLAGASSYSVEQLVVAASITSAIALGRVLSEREMTAEKVEESVQGFVDSFRNTAMDSYRFALSERESADELG